MKYYMIGIPYQTNNGNLKNEKKSDKTLKNGLKFPII